MNSAPTPVTQMGRTTIHRKSCLPLILAALLGLVRPGPPSALAQAPTAAGTVAEVTCPAIDLSRPEVQEALQEDLRDWAPDALKGIPATDALHLEAVVRPEYDIRRNFWTGRTEFVPRIFKGSTNCLKVLLVSYEDRPLLTAEVGYSGAFIGRIFGGPEMALALMAMKPGDKLTWFYREPWRDGYWLFDGKDLIRLEGYRAGERIRPDDLFNGTTFEGEGDPDRTLAITTMLTMLVINVVAYALLFPWRRLQHAAALSQEEV